MLERRAMTLFACWYHSYRKQQVNVIISGRSFGRVVLSSISENPLTLLKYFCSHHAHPTPSSGEGQEQLQWSQWKCSRKLGRITENMAWHTQEKVTPFTTPVQFPCCTTDEKLKETQILRLQVFILLLLTFLCIFFFYGWWHCEHCKYICIYFLHYIFNALKVSQNPHLPYRTCCSWTNRS